MPSRVVGALARLRLVAANPDYPRCERPAGAVHIGRVAWKVNRACPSPRPDVMPRSAQVLRVRVGLQNSVDAGADVGLVGHDETLLLQQLLHRLVVRKILVPPCCFRSATVAPGDVT